MTSLKVQPGEAISTKKQNRLVDRVLQSESGIPAELRPDSPTEALVKNVSGQDVEFGTVLTLGNYLGPTSDVITVPGNLSYEATVPTWHTDIARAVITLEPIPDGGFGYVSLSGQCVVKCRLGGTGEYYYGNDLGGEWVMINPNRTTEMIQTTGGIGKVLGRINDLYVAINFRHERPKFRYTITQLPFANTPYTATIHDQDGTQIGTELIRIFDELRITDYQGIGDEGFCELAGNKFHPVEGPC